MGRFSQAGGKDAFRSLSVTVTLESTAPITGRCSHCIGVSRSKTFNGKGFLSLQCTFGSRKAEPLGSRAAHHPSERVTEVRCVCNGTLQLLT